MIQFTRSHAPLDELKRELREELGLINGSYKKLSLNKHSRGNRTTGFNEIYIVTDFKLIKPKRDQKGDYQELQELIKLPIKNLFSTLSDKYIVDAETLLIAKLIEEKYSLKEI